MRAARSRAKIRSSADERQDEQEGQRRVLRDERGEQADRREQDVDEEHQADHPQLQAGVTPRTSHSRGVPAQRVAANWAASASR